MHARNALGARGTYISGEETYMGLKLGTIDASQWDVSAVTGLNWHEVAAYLKKVEALVKAGKVINSPIDAACDEAHEKAALQLWEEIAKRDPSAAKSIGIIKDWRKTLK